LFAFHCRNPPRELNPHVVSSEFSKQEKCAVTSETNVQGRWSRASEARRFACDARGERQWGDDARSCMNTGSNACLKFCDGESAGEKIICRYFRVTMRCRCLMQVTVSRERQIAVLLREENGALRVRDVAGEQQVPFGFAQGRLSLGFQPGEE
jgi:hypothetical protein